MNFRYLLPLALASTTLALACTDDGGGGTTTTDPSTETGSGDGDGDTGDGDGDSATGDGDGDTATGDGDGDTATGDGDGDTGGGAACMGTEAPAGMAAVGQPASHWAGFNVEGEDWDYCNLEGTPFLLIISAGWCPPCQDLAAGMAGQPSSWGTDLDPIRAGLEGGTLGVVEVLVDNFNDYGATSLQDLESWESMFPNDLVHLIGDPTPGQDGQEPLWIYLGPVHMGGLPSAILVDADFNIEATGLGESIQAAAANYGG